MTGEHRHHSACGEQSEERQEELDQRGDDRAVDDQQHARDRDEGEQGDLCEAGVADDVQVIGERGRASDVRLHSWRSLGVLDDLANGLNAFVGQRLALLAGEVEHHVRGLAVGALRSGSCQRVAPEVLDVLDVLGILPQLADDLVVVLVSIGAKRAAGPR